MESREIIVVSLVLLIEIVFSLVGIPGITFIKIFFVACIVFIISSSPWKTSLYYLGFSIVQTTLIIIWGYGFYISVIDVLSLWFIIDVAPWMVFGLVIVVLPFIQFVEVHLARLTIDRLKLRKRLGKF